MFATWLGNGTEQFDLQNLGFGLFVVFALVGTASAAVSLLNRYLESPMADSYIYGGTA